MAELALNMVAGSQQVKCGVCNSQSRTSTELLAPSDCSEWLDLVVLSSVFVPFYWHRTHFKEITDRGTRWSETRGALETYTHCMEHGLVVGKGTGPNYPGSGIDVSTFSRPNDQAKIIVKFWHFGTLDQCATEAHILDYSKFRTIRSYHSHRPCDFNSRVSAFFNSHDGLFP
jgi:hypothetical protein